MDRFLARELEIIAEMPRYYDWITDKIRPYVGGRGTHWRIMDRLLPEAVPGLRFDAKCKAGKETIAVAGVDCDGRAIP